MDKIDLTKKGMSIDTEYKKQRDKGTYTEIFNEYRDPATKYAFAVLENKIVACEMIKLDAFRHINDLVRSKENNFPFYFNLDECHKILGFASICPDVSSGKPLPLMLWQKSALCKMVGWRNKSDGTKRYTRAILSIARTNGKTYISNILIAYAYLIEAEGYSNQDMAYIAPVSAQVEKGWRYITTTFHYLENIPAVKKIFKNRKIRVVSDKVASEKDENRLSKLSQESGQFDSYHFLFAISDEAGDSDRIGKIKVNNGKITSGQVQTFNHQFLQISTAYPDSNSYLYADERMMRESMQKDYERTLDDYLCIVYEQDDLKETNNPELWIKSNPVLSLEGKESMLSSLVSERDTFMSQGKLEEFQNKNLNVWLQVKKNTYLDLDDIEKAIIDKRPFEDIKNREVYVGWDLSHVSDDTCIALVFPYDKDKFYIEQHSWVPLARAQNNITIKERLDGIDYRKAEKLGYATIANNQYGYIDENAPYEWLMELIHDKELDVKYFCYDAWQSDLIINQMEQKTDIPLMPIRQGTRSLNEPTTYFRKLMDTHRVSFLNDPIINASLKNAVLLEDNNGVKIDKDKATSKIDFADAVINTMVVAKYHFEDVDAIKAKESKSPFGNMSNEQINDYFKNDFSF